MYMMFFDSLDDRCISHIVTVFLNARLRPFLIKSTLCFHDNYSDDMICRPLGYKVSHPSLICPSFNCVVKKNVSSPSTRKTQYCGEPRGSVLGVRPPRFEFLILCLEGRVISLISPSSGASPGPI